MPASGGEATFLAADTRKSLWSVAADGIYYVNPNGGEIRAYRSSTGKVEQIARIPDSPALRTGFSEYAPTASPLLRRQTTRNDNDIMMLEVPGP